VPLLLAAGHFAGSFDFQFVIFAAIAIRTLQSTVSADRSALQFSGGGNDEQAEIPGGAAGWRRWSVRA
jgi:hypothetical protein